uniref:G-type lectin S-receptor-like serine/threonine-protein kinase LECRK1 n=1 Tax=Erigeron canadensis TaxID=72917 RepID=UPI001CB92CF0|nr:G-type lectin S-receptor-like serine/threonine-protein kinase LECRK1 [Erigeron canadensis]
MALWLLILLGMSVLLVTEGALVNESISYNISLGSKLTTDTNSSWLSPSGLFAFGFYQEGDGYFVGIWLTSKPKITVVWTANRDDPPVSSNSTIELTEDGWFLLHSVYGKKNIAEQEDAVTSASMFDSGNFVLYNHSEVIWKSFDYPCDTILGGQKLTSEAQLVSSVSDSQHSSGRFVLSMQSDGNLVAYPENSSKWDSDSYWSTGTFDSPYRSLVLNLDGSLYLDSIFNSSTKMVFNQTMSSWSRMKVTIVFRATLSPLGNFVMYSHRFTNPSSNLSGSMEWEALQDPCKARGICGVNSYCFTTDGNAECHCFPGFLFLKNSRDGKFLGCYRNFTDEEACSQRGLELSYDITALDHMEVGIYPYSVMNLSKEGCSKSCLDDCNCWVGLYLNGSCKMLKVPIIYAVYNKNYSVMALASFLFYRVHAHSHRYGIISDNVDFGLSSDHFTLRSFSFDELQKATDGFKEVIGTNSYGEVYRGFISEGKKAVAVKKLRRAFEGEGGFRAEITAIAQTHHRNLVRLLGFCINGVTKLLVYEFMSNGSLADLFNSKTPPGWKERVRVALDVARGILYLHEECETRIIHCNIEPHNILFDESWTAKISDFGLSKLLSPNQSGTLTGVRGTRGYLAPEWHKNTLISTKVDIYSFGVVLLEILCCRGDMEIDISCDDKMPFTTLAYSCFVANELTRLIGDEQVDIDMFEKMLNVGLLCIQGDPDARPSIKGVILMLEGTADIPTPQSPILL